MEPPEEGTTRVSGDWIENGVCRATDAEDLFVEGAAQNQAKTICFSCPVRTECLAYALEHRIEHGIWGGTTERERRGLQRSRPGLFSEQHALEIAQEFIADSLTAPALALRSTGAIPAG
jgi:WhiB family redox-sensing transcriptional regulator